MTLLLKSMAGSVLRKVLVSLGAYIAAVGMLSDVQLVDEVIGIGLALGGTAWSLWNKWRTERQR